MAAMDSNHQIVQWFPIGSMGLDDLPSHFPLFMWPFFTFHVGKSSSPMDPMGLVLKVA